MLGASRQEQGAVAHRLARVEGERRGVALEH
jgi:hypothetical protein